MKKSKKRLFIVLSVILITLLTAGIVFASVVFWYYPSYAKDDTFFDIQTQPQTDEIKTMSFNVRCYTPTDLFKRNWYYRAPLVIQTIAAQTPDVIGFQEINPRHYKYLTKHLVGYEFLLAYRTSSGPQEGVMLAYRSDRFEKTDQGKFWLSETPQVESKDWGSAFCRVATYVELKDKVTSKTIMVVNTHLDHKSKEARGKSMDVILEQKKEVGSENFILMGDMNDYESSLMYEKAITGGLYDASKIALQKDARNRPTYQGYGEKLDAKPIDFIFTSQTATVKKFRVVDDVTQDYSSDHFAIYAEIVF